MATYASNLHSPEAWSSAWVQEELQLAFVKRRRIIPVLHQQTEDNGLIQTRQWIDVIGMSPEQAATNVFAQINGLA
jgi:TIR domain